VRYIYDEKKSLKKIGREVCKIKITPYLCNPKANGTTAAGNKKGIVLCKMQCKRPL
jgi:hypothetical protein